MEGYENVECKCVRDVKSNSVFLNNFLFVFNEKKYSCLCFGVVNG